MLNLSERIAILIKDVSDGNVSVFANKIGMNQATIHNYTKGRAPNTEFYFNVCNILGVNINWLLTGKGEKFLSTQYKITPIDVIELGNINFDKCFKNEVLAIEINQILKEIEDLDETHLREIKGLLRAELSQLRNRPERRSGMDRRKEDIPELAPEEDRRSGIERRVAGLNR
jgi:transcriptional regulator with XRE-family HTH domain